MPHKKITFTAALLAIPVVATLALSTETHAADYTRIWVGETSNNFSTGTWLDENGDPASTPNATDTYAIILDANRPTSDVFATSPFNDIAGLKIDSLEVIAKDNGNDTFSCPRLTADSQIILSGSITFDPKCPSNTLEGSITLGGDLLAENTHFIDLTAPINLNGYGLTFESTPDFPSTNTFGIGSPLDSVDNLTGNGQIVFDGMNGVAALYGHNTYSGTTELSNTGEWATGVSGNSLTMFGTSVVNLTQGTVSFRFEENLSGAVISNEFNINGGQTDDIWGSLQFWCTNSSCVADPEDPLRVPNIILHGNSSLDLIGFLDKGLVIDLTGITSNGHCLEYWVDSLASYMNTYSTVAGGFINGPASCEIDGGDQNGPGVPNTGSTTNDSSTALGQIIGAIASLGLISIAILTMAKRWLIRKVKF